jgi:hypothetical protein
MVMTAMSEGVDISAAGRIFDHHHTTITRWIEPCGHHSERLHERLFHLLCPSTICSLMNW